jgi:hypothetical protein
VDPVTGFRTLLSDFGNAAQGPTGAHPQGVVLGLAGAILVVDMDASFGPGRLFSVDAATGARTVLSDFANRTQGPGGFDPFDLALGPGGTILVTDPNASPTVAAVGALFSVDAATGARTVLSDFADRTQGPAGKRPLGVALEATGDILVLDSAGGTGGVGALFRVHPTTGLRTVLSDFGNGAQGVTGARPFGLALFPVTDELCATDVALRVTRGGFRRVPSTGRYRQMVTIRNTGTTPIQGPVSLVLDNLSSNATLLNKHGDTRCATPVSPLRRVNVGADQVLSPGESGAVTLEFANPTNRSITYNTRVLSGTPQ